MEEVKKSDFWKKLLNYNKMKETKKKGNPVTMY